MSKAERTRLCVGVDLHKHQFTTCAIEVDGGLVEHEAEYRTDVEGYQRFCDQLHRFETHKGYQIELAVETTGNAKYFKNRMEKEGFAVTVVNTNKFKVITLSTKKTDANDAATLAYYLMKEMLPASYLCDQTSEEIRRVLKTRSILVSSTVKIKNQIHGMMLGYGIETKTAQFQSKKKRQELLHDLADHGFSEFTASSLEVTLNILDNIYEQIKSCEKQLDEMLANDEAVRLLQTVPGIGPIGAATITAYTRDIERFDGDFKRFASYIGIVPSVHNSGDAIRLGKITKHGPQELRTAFVQVAMGWIRMPEKTAQWKVMSDYRTMKVNKGSGRAIIALTRKIARIVFVMLNEQMEFNPARMALAKQERISKKTN